MNLNCFSKCLMISAITLTRSVAAFSTEREGRGGKREGEKKPYLICLSSHVRFSRHLFLLNSSLPLKYYWSSEKAAQKHTGRSPACWLWFFCLFLVCGLLVFFGWLFCCCFVFVCPHFLPHPQRNSLGNKANKLALKPLSEDATDPRINKPVSLPGKLGNKSQTVQLTYRVLYPPDGTWLGRQPGARNRQAQGWKPSGCSVRTYDTTGRWESAARPKRNDCHPRGRGNAKVCLFPAGRSHRI